MKATEQHFPMVLFITLSKVVLSWKSVDEILTCDLSNESCWSKGHLWTGQLTVKSILDKILSLTIQMKATEQYFPVVLFIVLYQVVITSESVDEILQCNHSNESYWAVLSCGTVYCAVSGGYNIWICGWNPSVQPFKWKLLSSTFLWYCWLYCIRWL